MDQDKVARALGWFSVGLGLAEIAAPRALGRFFGMEDRAGLLRAFGAREIAAGVGILTQERRAPWMWARVGGDVLDLAALSTGLGPRNRHRGRVAAAIGVVAAITAVDAVCARQLAEQEDGAERSGPRPHQVPRPPGV